MESTTDWEFSQFHWYANYGPSVRILQRETEKICKLVAMRSLFAGLCLKPLTNQIALTREGSLAGPWCSYFRFSRRRYVFVLVLIRDFHTRELASCFRFRNLNVSDVTVSGFGNLGDVFFKLIGGALDDHFNGAVGQILDPTRNFVAAGDYATGVAEADALDAAGEVDVPTFHRDYFRNS